MRPEVAVAVLAAGSGTRMGGPKAELVVDGQRLLDRAILAFAPTYAVVRAGTAAVGTRLLVNDQPERGLHSSLALAVATASKDGYEALAVLLVDMPEVVPEALRLVTNAWAPGRAALARYGDGSGHPVVLGLESWAEALALAGPDEGARAWLRRHPELVEEIDVPGSARDLDTPADL